jgi:hypothetical protein
MTSRLGAAGVLLALALSAPGAIAAFQPADPVAQFCLPQWAQETLLHEGTGERFELVDILARPVVGACAIAPWFVEGDFNGDGKPDVAVRGRDRKSDFYGILIVHGGAWKLYGIGFHRLDVDDEKKTYRLSHIRTHKGGDGKDALLVTPFKYEADVWRWTGSTYELGAVSKP